MMTTTKPNERIVLRCYAPVPGSTTPPTAEDPGMLTLTDSPTWDEASRAVLRLANHESRAAQLRRARAEQDGMECIVAVSYDLYRVRQRLVQPGDALVPSWQDAELGDWCGEITLHNDEDDLRTWTLTVSGDTERESVCHQFDVLDTKYSTMAGWLRGASA